MKKSERNAIVRWAESATDEELEKEYYDCVFSSLGSQAENMCELGYDLVDIKERELYEKFLCQKSSLLEELCQKRSIELWKKAAAAERHLMNLLRRQIGQVIKCII